MRRSNSEYQGAYGIIAGAEVWAGGANDLWGQCVGGQALEQVLRQTTHQSIHTFSICYVIPAEVESHPFDLDTMLFMDWRDDHTQNIPDMKAANEKLPTFLYAMPFTKNKVRLGH